MWLSVAESRDFASSKIYFYESMASSSCLVSSISSNIASSNKNAFFYADKSSGYSVSNKSTPARTPVRISKGFP